MFDAGDPAGSVAAQGVVDVEALAGALHDEAEAQGSVVAGSRARPWEPTTNGFPAHASRKRASRSSMA
jgi:hypothetical protein